MIDGFYLNVVRFSRERLELGVAMLEVPPAAVLGHSVMLCANMAEHLGAMDSQHPRLAAGASHGAILEDWASWRGREDWFAAFAMATPWSRYARLNGPSRRKIDPVLRSIVYARDGHACRFCRSVEDLTLDHIVPFSLGGPDTFENLRALCRRCNSARGARCDM